MLYKRIQKHLSQGKKKKKKKLLSLNKILNAKIAKGVLNDLENLFPVQTKASQIGHILITLL